MIVTTEFGWLGLMACCWCAARLLVWAVGRVNR